MSAHAIPTTMDQVTPAWLTAALRESGVISAASITSIDKVIIGTGVGILGELARVTLTYDRAEPGAPKTLVAKIPTADPGGRGIAQMLGFYEKEARFYTDMAADCAVGAPKCYYTAMNPEKVEYIILMEDMAGLRIGDQVVGCSADEARLISRNLARFHAQWWDSPNLDELSWVPGMDSPIQALVVGAYLQSIEPFLAFAGDRLTEAQRNVVLALGPRVQSMQESLSVAPATLAHGDPRLDNIFFGSPDGSNEITFIDWQILLKGRGTYDIGYLLSQSLAPADRKANEDSIVREYHATLMANGVSGYAWDQCWSDYRASVLFCLVYPVIAGGSVEMANERAVALLHAMTDRSVAAITDLGCANLLANYEERPFVMPGA
jgi:hypothetical protein